MGISEREPEDKGPACDCGSTAVIDANRHAWDCKRRLWVERNDARIEHRGAVRKRDALAWLYREATGHGPSAADYQRAIAALDSPPTGGQ